MRTSLRRRIECASLLAAIALFATLIAGSSANVNARQSVSVATGASAKKDTNTRVQQRPRAQPGASTANGTLADAQVATRQLLASAANQPMRSASEALTGRQQQHLMQLAHLHRYQARKQVAPSGSTDLEQPSGGGQLQQLDRLLALAAEVASASPATAASSANETADGPVKVIAGQPRNISTISASLRHSDGAEMGRQLARRPTELNMQPESESGEQPNDSVDLSGFDLEQPHRTVSSHTPTDGHHHHHHQQQHYQHYQNHYQHHMTNTERANRAGEPLDTAHPVGDDVGVHSAARSARLSQTDHSQLPMLIPVLPSSLLGAYDDRSSSSSGSGAAAVEQLQPHSDRHRPSNIKVVFNNNPKFIIGAGADASAESASLVRRARQPASALTYADEYQSAADESTADESKMSPTKVAPNSLQLAEQSPNRKRNADDLEQPPCAKERRTKVSQRTPLVNIEQLDLRPPPDPPISQIPTSPLPPPPVKQQQQQEQVSLADQQQVDVPFQEMVKSGMRPPLRMVISVRNKHGDVMRVPINLPGATGKQTTPTIQLGPQMQIHFERPQQKQPQQTIELSPQTLAGNRNEDTPSGGDIFDPNNVRPFEKSPKTTVSKAPEVPKTVMLPEEPVKKALEPVKMPELVLTTRRPHCRDDDSQTDDDENLEDPNQHQQQVIASTAGGDSLMHLTMPKVNELRNRTFANMFVQFQKALGEQMQQQQPIQEQHQQPVQEQQQQQIQQLKQTTQQQQPQQQLLDRPMQENLREHAQTKLDRDEAIRKQLDEQEDLMVAMMAANATGALGGASGRTMSMTIIRPPKGTSVEEAIEKHARNSPDHTRTVAILHSKGPRRGAGGALANLPLPQAPGEQAQPIGLDVRLKPGGNPLQVQPLEGDSAADPDGFSSSSSDTVLDAQRHFEHQLEHLRFRRSANDSLAAPERQLEPSDRLGGRWSSRSSPGQAAKDKHAHRQQAKDKLGRQEDAIVASATESSHANEVPDEEDADEEDAEPSDTEEVSSAPSTSSNDADLADENDANELNDDADDSSSFDADDEPFNQGASSERDYNSPSFEIPQIDISLDSLRQQGCRTVLREVQEIPMNGLGAVQANGTPGSGYLEQASGRLAGKRVKRGANNDNLINSRKVTSIVMTKECHFPNAEMPGDGRQQQQQPANPYKAVERVALEPAELGGASQRLAPMQLPLASQQPTYMMQVRPPAPNRVQAQPLVQQPWRYMSAPSAANYYGSGMAAESAPRAAATLDAGSQQTAGKSQQQEQTQAHRPIQVQMGGQVRQPQVKAAPAGASPPQSSSIRRRSLDERLRTAGGPMEREQSPQTRDSRTSEQSQRQKAEKDFYMSADSRPVAQKLYKPPSADDPFHTLSYSSQNGVDPDRSDDQTSNEEDNDDDDDPTVTMDSETDPKRRRRRQPRTRHPSQRTAASNRRRMHEALSESERRALMDPNYDDTDPVRERSFEDQNNDDMDDDTNRQPAGESDDADETDGDLADESRQVNSMQRLPEKASRAGAKGADQVKQLVHKRVARSKATERARARPAPPIRIYDGADERKFGKSFRFEHEVGRAQPSGLMAQLSRLKPGRQGYVSLPGQSVGSSLANGAKQAPAERRSSDPEGNQEAGDDPDEDEDDDSPAERRSAASANPSTEEAEEDDPDADPEYNPRETHLPQHSKPKRVQKSFAYVHRDIPKKGSKDPDDFLVSYGRGNVQTEQEDYDSDRDNQPRERHEQPNEEASAPRPQVAQAKSNMPASGQFGRQHPTQQQHHHHFQQLYRPSQPHQSQLRTLINNSAAAGRSVAGEKRRNR